MSFDRSITEQDLDAAEIHQLKRLRGEADDEPDLAVDGLSHSLLSRLFGLFRPRGG